MNQSLALFAIAAVAQAHAGHGVYGAHSHDSAPQLVRNYGSNSYGGLAGNSFAAGFGGYGAGRGYGGYGGYSRNYDSDGPRRSAYDKDGDSYGHENGPHDSTEFGEKDNHGGDDREYRGYGSVSRGYGYGRRHQELDLDDDRRGSRIGGIGSIGGYGKRYGGYNYDSDGPRRSAHDKDGDSYGHENGPHDNTEFGEKDNHGGDDREYGRGYGSVSQGYGYGRRHQELDLDDDRRSYGGYGYGGYGGYGRKVGGINYDSDGPRRSSHDKDADTYGHENGPHDSTEFGEKDNHGGDDRDYGYGYGRVSRGYGYGRRHQELDLDDERRGNSYGGYGRRSYGRSNYGW